MSIYKWKSKIFAKKRLLSKKGVLLQKKELLLRKTPNFRKKYKNTYKLKVLAKWVLFNIKSKFLPKSTFSKIGGFTT